MSDHSKVRFCPADQHIHNRLGLAKTQLQQLLTETVINLIRLYGFLAKSEYYPESIKWYPVIKLYSSHDEGRHEVIWTRHNWLAMEQDTRIIQFQDIRLAAELWGVVDVYSVLDERFVMAGITWLTGIDRYLEEGSASAAQGFQREREYCAPYTLEMVSQFLRDNCTHLGLLSAFINTET